MHTDHEVFDLVGIAEEDTRLHQQLAVVGLDANVVTCHVGGLQGTAQVTWIQAVRGQRLRIEFHPDHVVGGPDGIDVARPRYALEFGLDGVRDLTELECTRASVIRPERNGHDRNIVDALGLDDRLTHTDTGRQPVLVRHDLAVKAHYRVGTVFTDQILHGQYRHAGHRGRVHVFDTVDLVQHLFGRRRDQTLHLARRCARERDEDVGEGHIDLRLFLARRHQHRKHAQQQPDQRQQRCYLGGLEAPRYRSGESELIHRPCVPGAVLSTLSLPPPGRWRAAHPHPPRKAR